MVYKNLPWLTAMTKGGMRLGFFLPVLIIFLSSACRKEKPVPPIEQKPVPIDSHSVFNADTIPRILDSIVIRNINSGAPSEWDEDGTNADVMLQFGVSGDSINIYNSQVIENMKNGDRLVAVFTNQNPRIVFREEAWLFTVLDVDSNTTQEMAFWEFFPTAWGIKSPCIPPHQEKGEPRLEIYYHE
jgi:hypothetical protein